MLPNMAQPEAPATEPPATEPPNKRKRDAEDSDQQSRDRIPQPLPPPSGDGPLINYLARASPTRLRLMQGNSECFTDVIGLIGEYEAVLSRNESLAGNLGAKLTAPKLVRAMEGLFEEPLRITHRDPYISEPVAWLDVVQFAKSNPNDFRLVTSPDHRRRYCTLYLKGNQLEITEDDWRLIMSGTLDRFNLAPLQPVEEDEKTEFATLEILEQRLQILIKRADEVARKARQLNYHLLGRKAAISARYTESSPPPDSASSPPAPNAEFQVVNYQQSQMPGSNLPYDIYTDLLQQFTGQTHMVPIQNSVSMPTTPVIQQPAQSVSAMPVQPFRSPAVSNALQVQRSTTHRYDPSDLHRPLITARMEKLGRGDAIYPPCDRCRRLNVECTKHLTACQGCTKKHAKCSWKGMMNDEVAWLRREARSGGGSTEGDDGGSGSSGRTPDPQPKRSKVPIPPRPFPMPPAIPNVTIRNGNGNGNGNGATNSEPRAPQERSVTESGGPREHPGTPPIANHYQLTHTATMALNAEAARRQQQQQQQQHSQSPVMRRTSVQGD